MKLLIKSKADAVVPITRFNFPIQRALKINDGGNIEMILPEHMYSRSQDLMPTYHDCGQFGFFKITDFIGQKKPFTGKTLPIIVPESEVQDIDNEEDWKMAEMKYTILRNLN